MVTVSPAAASATTAEAFCFRARIPTSDMCFNVAHVGPSAEERNEFHGEEIWLGVRLAVRSGRSKDPEIIVLRHQVQVLHRQVERPAVTDDDRTMLGAIAAALPRQLRKAGFAVVNEIEFLKPVDIRQVWKREDRDFTPWVAEPEPLGRLLAECGIDLGSDYSVRKEVRVPGVRRSLDILVETEYGTRVAIENQYAESDHDHMTRALAWGRS